MNSSAQADNQVNRASQRRRARFHLAVVDSREIVECETSIRRLSSCAWLPADSRSATGRVAPAGSACAQFARASPTGKSPRQRTRVRIEIERVMSSLYSDVTSSPRGLSHHVFTSRTWPRVIGMPSLMSTPPRPRAPACRRSTFRSGRIQHFKSSPDAVHHDDIACTRAHQASFFSCPRIRALFDVAC